MIEAKTKQILNSKKGPRTHKKMPTYESVMRHIQKVVQKTGKFEQIYPLPAGVEDPYQFIY